MRCWPTCQLGHSSPGEGQEGVHLLGAMWRQGGEGTQCYRDQHPVSDGTEMGIGKRPPACWSYESISQTSGREMHCLQLLAGPCVRACAKEGIMTVMEDAIEALPVILDVLCIGSPSQGTDMEL